MFGFTRPVLPFVVLFVLVGCKDDPVRDASIDASVGAPGARLGAGCADDRDCASGSCRRTDGLVAGSVCSKDCAVDADCNVEGALLQPLVCGADGKGGHECVAPCTSSGLVGVLRRVVCVDGVPTRCEDTDGSYCASCGCAATERCERSVGCMPKSEVGGACLEDSDCKTDNCSTFAHVCRVPVGQPCNKTNCDRCLSNTAGFSYCSRDCDYKSMCGNGSCVIPRGTSELTCYPPCTASCPGQDCGTVTDGSSYCRCTGCSVAQPSRQLGEECLSNEQCGSGLCNDVDTFTGYCSRSCVAASDCGAGYACGPGQSASAALTCIPLCDAEGQCSVGTCREIAGARVCDLRLGLGSSCRDNLQCENGKCTAGKCGDAGGVVNGEACTLPAECLSGSCVNGRCAGQQLLGDPCTQSGDCAVGMCCPTSKICGKTC